MTTPVQPDLLLTPTPETASVVPREPNEITATPPPKPAFRVPDDATIPPTLRGKSVDEIADYVAMLEAAVSGSGSPPTPPASTPTPAPPTPVAPPNGTYVTADQFQQLADRQVATTIALAEKEFADDFRKYGQEIQQALAGVPRHQVTLDTIRHAVQFVRGAHVDEIVAEKIRSQHATGFPSMRGTGGGGGGVFEYPAPQPANPSAQAIQRWQARAASEGITDQQIRELCDANGISTDEFWKQFGGGLVSDAVADVGKKRNGSS